MTTYTELWREVETRLRAAFALMQADAPTAAARRDVQFRDWLDHNELELALDELLDGARDHHAVLRRRFWEELATAALRMTVKPQFLAIADLIPNLEPHIFGTDRTPPHVYCDFNGLIEADVYSLNGIGTALDFARLRTVPSESQDLVLYDEDVDGDGRPTWLLADARITGHEPYGLVGKVRSDSYRSQRR